MSKKVLLCLAASSLLAWLGACYERPGGWYHESAELDALERDLRSHGLITIKRPDVWTENRLQKYRKEFEKVFAADVDKFEPSINAKVAQVQLQRLGLAADIALAMSGRAPGGGDVSAGLSKHIATAMLENMQGSSGCTAEQFAQIVQAGVKSFLGKSIGLGPGKTAALSTDSGTGGDGNGDGGNGDGGSGSEPGGGDGGSDQPEQPVPGQTPEGPPTPRAAQRPVFNWLLDPNAVLNLPTPPGTEMISAFEKQAQKRAYVFQNHLFRIGNEPDDGTRMNGYRLYYMRFMVSVTPSWQTRQCHSAEILLSPTYDLRSAARDWCAQYARALLREQLMRTLQFALERAVASHLLKLKTGGLSLEQELVAASCAEAGRKVRLARDLLQKEGDLDGAENALLGAEKHLRGLGRPTGEIQKALQEIGRIRQEHKRGASPDQVRKFLDTSSYQRAALAARLGELVLGMPEGDRTRGSTMLLAGEITSLRRKSLAMRALAQLAYDEYAGEVDHLLGVPIALDAKSSDNKSTRIRRADGALGAICRLGGAKGPGPDLLALAHKIDKWLAILKDTKDKGSRQKLEKQIVEALKEGPAKQIYEALPELTGVPGLDQPKDPNILTEARAKAFRDLIRTLRADPFLNEPDRQLLQPLGCRGVVELVKKSCCKLVDIAKQSDDRRPTRPTTEWSVSYGKPLDLWDFLVVQESEAACSGPTNSTQPVIKTELEDMEKIRRFLSPANWPVYTFAVAPFSEAENISRAVQLNNELQLLLNLGLKYGSTMNAELALAYARALREQYQAIQVNRTVVGLVRGEQHFGWQINPPYSIPVGRDWLDRNKLVVDEAKSLKMPPRTYEVFALVAIPGFLRSIDFTVHADWTAANRADRREIGTKKAAMLMRRYRYLENQIESKWHIGDGGKCTPGWLSWCGKGEGDAEDRVILGELLADKLDLIGAELPLRKMRKVFLPYADVSERMTNTAGIANLQPRIYGIDPFFVPSHHKIVLTITGKNFDTGDVDVLVGGVKASEVKLANDHTIIASIPARGFVGDLEVRKRSFESSAGVERPGQADGEKPDGTAKAPFTPTKYSQNLNDVEGLVDVTVITPVGVASELTLIRVTHAELSVKPPSKPPAVKAELNPAEVTLRPGPEAHLEIILTPAVSAKSADLTIIGVKTEVKGAEKKVEKIRETIRMEVDDRSVKSIEPIKITVDKDKAKIEPDDLAGFLDQEITKLELRLAGSQDVIEVRGKLKFTAKKQESAQK